MAKRKHVKLMSNKEAKRRIKENPLKASISIPMLSIAEIFINTGIDTMNEKEEAKET